MVAVILVSSRDLKNIMLAITLGQQREDSLTPIDSPELETAWTDLEVEIAEIKAKGGIVDIPWDPFDE
jgi:hypothetical protein